MTNKITKVIRIRYNKLLILTKLLYLLNPKNQNRNKKYPHHQEIEIFHTLWEVVLLQVNKSTNQNQLCLILPVADQLLSWLENKLE